MTVPATHLISLSIIKARLRDPAYYALRDRDDVQWLVEQIEQLSLLATAKPARPKRHYE